MRVVSLQSWVGGGRRKRKLRFVQTLLLIFLHISPEIHGTIWIIGGWLRNFLWHYSVYLCNWSSHMHQHSVVVAYLYCVSFYCAGNMLLPRYPWYIDSQHNIITPSIHSQISFLSTHPHWLQSKLFPNTRIITSQQTPIQCIHVYGATSPMIIVNTKLPFLVLDVGSLICILQFRTQLSEMAGSEYGISSTGKPATWHTGPVVCSYK